MRSMTTDATLDLDLRRSLGISKPIETVGDLLNALMAHGLTLDTPLASIEFGVRVLGNRRIEIKRAFDGIEIREGSR